MQLNICEDEGGGWASEPVASPGVASPIAEPRLPAGSTAALTAALGPTPHLLFLLMRAFCT